MLLIFLSLCNKKFEVEKFYEDLQDLSELTPKKDVLFVIGDWNAKVGSQETPGVGLFCMWVQDGALCGTATLKGVCV